MLVVLNELIKAIENRQKRIEGLGIRIEFLKDTD